MFLEKGHNTKSFEQKEVAERLYISSKPSKQAHSSGQLTLRFFCVIKTCFGGGNIREFYCWVQLLHSVVWRYF